MAYVKKIWKDYPDTTTPILTEDLNNIENGIYDIDTRLTTAEAVIGNETDTYSASSTYALGDLVIYNSLLYKCTTAITVAEAWTVAHWTQVNLVDSCNYINNNTVKYAILSEQANYTYNFNGQTHAFQNITLTNNIADNKTITVHFVETGLGDNMEMDAIMLNSGLWFRKRILLAGIQSYVRIKKIDNTTLEVYLEHTGTIAGTKLLL